MASAHEECGIAAIFIFLRGLAYGERDGEGQMTSAYEECGIDVIFVI